MRALFLGVCLLNVLFFFWEWRQQGYSHTTDQPHSALPTILLAEELERARRGAAISEMLDRKFGASTRLSVELPPAPDRLTWPKVETETAEPVAEPAEASVEPPPSVCYEAGPFADEAAANVWLAEQALQGVVFNREVSIPSSFLVYYPAAKNDEQTRANKAMLSAKGISDMWTVPSGDLKGVISLGLSNDMPHAMALKQQLAQLGVHTEIKERFKNQSRPFVKFRSEKEMPPASTPVLSPLDCAKL